MTYVPISLEVDHFMSELGGGPGADEHLHFVVLTHGDLNGTNEK